MGGRRRHGLGSVLAAIGLGFVLFAPQARAETAVGAAAEAYGLTIDAKLLAGNVPVAVPPQAWASQDYPPGADQAATAQALATGPVPADGSLVGNAGVMTSTAAANKTPQAVAAAQVADLALLGAGDNAQISADVVRAQANSDCSSDPNATGTTFVNLVVGGQAQDATPPPNTVIDLGVAKVILNEQHPAFDGRGIVVNAIHVISTTTGDPLFRGDIIVSHAMSTVSCANGKGTTGSANEIKMTKTVTPTSTTAGKEVTYTATFTNSSDDDCLVNEAIDHLPLGFTVVSTKGDLGDTSTTRDRPGGGQDVIVGNGKTIAAGGSATQTFTVKVGESVKPGTYFNNVELFCANLGNFVKGLDAPVEIVAEVTTTTTTTEPVQPRQLPETGGRRDLAVVGGFGLMLAGLGIRLRRAVR